MNQSLRFLSLGLALLGLSYSLPAKAESIVTEWNNLALQAIRDTHPGPPIVARQLAIVHTAMYDAWAPYDAKANGTRLYGSLRRPQSERTEASKKEAISYGAYRTLVDLYPSQKAKFDSFMTKLGYDPNNITSDTSKPAGIGNVTSKALVDFRHQDGSNQSNGYKDTTGYKPVNTPTQVNDINRWQPLSVPDGEGGFKTQSFIAPHWGNVKPFALSSYDEFLPDLTIKAPKTIESDPIGFKNQAQQVIDYSANLTEKQKVIAEYWADGPKSELPPGHWNLFAQYISNRDSHNLDEDVKMFFALNNSLLDASIASWGIKSKFDSVRPVTAIQELFKGEDIKAWAGPNKGTQTIKGEDWQPYQAATVVTPPFAEFLSGHSAYSAASAEVLKNFTGSDLFGDSVTIKAGTSRVEDGPSQDITLNWPTFSDAADEAGISRRYGGIHFEDGDLAGRQLGRLIGDNTWDKAQSYFSGSAIPEPSTVLGLLSFSYFANKINKKLKK